MFKQHKRLESADSVKASIGTSGKEKERCDNQRVLIKVAVTNYGQGGSQTSSAFICNAMQSSGIQYVAHMKAVNCGKTRDQCLREISENIGVVEDVVRKDRKRNAYPLEIGEGAVKVIYAFNMVYGLDSNKSEGQYAVKGEDLGKITGAAADMRSAASQVIQANQVLE